MRHRWSISDVIAEIWNIVMPSDCSALRFRNTNDSIDERRPMAKLGHHEMFRLRLEKCHFLRRDMELEDEDIDVELGFRNLFSTMDSYLSIYGETANKRMTIRFIDSDKSSWKNCREVRL
ncbi:hypothetical protein ANN_23585 [Periplaneta americana]|uniref:Uncharacterized protein n=1 Tax=Periplaneta americana TaxID=6978 RepID=A0ABQ8SLI9_PERAM|nr:hypothetical protein ANN_23585 [Periplaneta americana]